MDNIHSFQMLSTIYSQLKEIGLVRHQQDFSINWLGRSQDYYAYLKAHDKEPSTEVVRYLHHMLLLGFRCEDASQTDAHYSASQQLCFTFLAEDPVINLRQKAALKRQA